MSHQIRITAAWREEPDVERLVQAFLGLAEQLVEVEADDAAINAHVSENTAADDTVVEGTGS